MGSDAVNWVNEDTIQAVQARIECLSQMLDKRYMQPSQAKRILSLLCKYNRPPKYIVEVGTFAGTGAIMLATMADAWGGHVTTIDLPWTGGPNKHFAKIVDDWTEELSVENLTIIRRNDGAEGWFHDHLRHDHKPIDFIYIDGGHNWINLCAQFAMAYTAVRVGGWICFDDIENSKWPDVRDAWNIIVPSIARSKHIFKTGQLGFVMKSNN